MQMTFTFPGGLRVDGHGTAGTVVTDQGPGATAPSPFALFLASIGACAGYYVLEFCRSRGIPTDGIAVHERTEADADGHVSDVHLDVQLPETFPAKYASAVIRAAEQCTVKKHLERPPAIHLTTVVPAAA